MSSDDRDALRRDGAVVALMEARRAIDALLAAHGEYSPGVTDGVPPAVPRSRSLSGGGDDDA